VINALSGLLIRTLIPIPTCIIGPILGGTNSKHLGTLNVETWGGCKVGSPLTQGFETPFQMGLDLTKKWAH